GAGPATSSRSGRDLRYSSGQAQANSEIRGGVLVSEAEVSLGTVRLLDGLVQASGVHLVVQATASGKGVTASTAGSSVSGLTVNGEAVSTDGGVVSIDGVGTLAVLGASSDGSSPSASAEVVGLRLTLSAPAAGLPAGVVIVVGHAAARADQATWRSLAGPPPSSPKPRPKPSTTKSATPPGTSTRSGDTATGTSGASASPGARFDPSVMPTPELDAQAAAMFPGAVFPVLGAYSYSNDWLAPRGARLHHGTDIFAASGTPLVAAQDGTIDRMSNGDYGLGGISLHVTNDRGDYFYYAHMSGYAPGIHEGLRVRAGDVVGYVGNTGNAAATPSHVHFEIHPGGGPAINPFPFLEAWRAQGALQAGTAQQDQPTPADVTQQVQAQVGNPEGPDYWKVSSRTLAQAPAEALLVPLLTPLHPEPRHDRDGGTDPISGLPLALIGALGAAVHKRFQLAALLP
ncbi:MAG TPA: M23 family metallopeptidase, partial [Thermoleophilia bacterium]|nr:M23 family metallopeptidase [Thermoleophilia bacterium]